MIHRKLNLKFIFFLIFCAGISFVSSAQRILTIEEALDIAEENNPNIRTSKLSLERTQFLLDAQYAGLKPRFSLDVNPFGYSQTRRVDSRTSDWYTNRTTSSEGTFRAAIPILPTDGQLTLTNTFGWSENWSKLDNDASANSAKAFTNNLRLTLDQPLFTPNNQKMEFKRLELDYENAGISYALQRLRTEQQITTQFYNVFMSLNNLEISNERLKNETKNYEIISYKVEADMSPKEELFQAEVNLAQARSSVEQNIVTLNNAKDLFKQTLGMPLSEDITVTADIEINPMLVDLDQAIQHGLDSRLELRQREMTMEREELSLITEKARNAFSGNVRLSLGVMGDNQNLTNIYDQPVNSPSINMTFSIPIFDWGQRKARIQAQKTSQVIARLNYEEEIVGIELNIRQTLRSLNNIRTQISISEKTVENSLRTYELQQVRYREGELSGLQMQQYQSQLSDSRTALAQQKINYKNTLLNLKILTLYDFEKDEPIVPVTGLSNTTTHKK